MRILAGGGGDLVQDATVRPHLDYHRLPLVESPSVLLPLELKNARMFTRNRALLRGSRREIVERRPEIAPDPIHQFVERLVLDRCGRQDDVERARAVRCHGEEVISAIEQPIGPLETDFVGVMSPPMVRRS